VLRRIVAADGTIEEGTRESGRVGDVEEVGDVQGRGGEAVNDADRPSFLGEASVPCTDKGAYACSRCARRTRRSSHLRLVWGEGDHDRFQNPGAGRGGQGEWRGDLQGPGRFGSPLCDVL